MLIRSKVTPGNSPRAERSHSQHQLARSEPGGAMRAMMMAMASARCVPVKPSRQAEPLHGPQPDSLDAGRARADQLQSAHIHRLQGGALDGGARLRSCAAMRCAYRSTSCGQDSDTSSPWQSSSRWIRAHSTGQCRRSSGKSLTRLSRVCWRTLSPLRSLRTRRDGYIDLAAVACAYLGAPDEQGAKIAADPAPENPHPKI